MTCRTGIKEREEKYLYTKPHKKKGPNAYIKREFIFAIDELS